jgi:hypothetical protein
MQGDPQRDPGRKSLSATIIDAEHGGVEVAVSKQGRHDQEENASTPEISHGGAGQQPPGCRSPSSAHRPSRRCVTFKARSPSPTSPTLTGEGASQNGSSPAGFYARIDLQNAEGGVDGHKIVGIVIDDQTNPSEISTAVQSAVSKAFGIVSQSPLFFLAAKYPQQAGVPVTGTYDDGPEWGTQPYTNMFASDERFGGPEVPGQHRAGQLPQELGRHRARLLRIRHLAVVQPCCDCDRGLVRARRAARSGSWTRP